MIYKQNNTYVPASLFQRGHDYPEMTRAEGKPMDALKDQIFQTWKRDTESGWDFVKEQTEFVPPYTA